ncbi:MAG: hypothetical protein GY913_12910 [Proteobacteria bacterium]|nr:hypothetical protein [Pseudomonadota bacterium]
MVRMGACPTPYGESDEGDEEYFGYEGLVALWYGPMSGAMTTGDADGTLLGHPERASYNGAVVKTGFDWDGDGLPDVATGAPGYSVDDESTLGAFYLETATPSGDMDLPTAHLVITGGEDELFGGDASIADLDGDGELDLLVGCGYAYVSANSASYTNCEGAWLFYGPLSGDLTTADADTHFEGDGLPGGEVMLLPDQDGDGTGEVLISDLDSSDGALLVFDHPEY